MIASFILAVTDDIDPNSPLDWGVVILIAVGVLSSVGQGMKKIIAWVVDKITAPDTRMEELERAKAERDEADRQRMISLEETVEKMRQELLKMHLDLKESEIARTRTEGELETLKLRYEAYEIRLESMGRLASMGKFVDDGWLELGNERAEELYGVRIVIDTDPMDEQLALGHEVIPIELIEPHQMPSPLQQKRRAAARSRVSKEVRTKAELPNHIRIETV